MGAPNDNVALQLARFTDEEELEEYLNSIYPETLVTLTSHAHFGLGTVENEGKMVVDLIVLE